MFIILPALSVLIKILKDLKVINVKKANLKSESYIILNNNETIKTSKKCLALHKQKIIENISQTLSNYYTSHPDEINNLK